jgi:hypothetical protein
MLEDRKVLYNHPWNCSISATAHKSSATATGCLHSQVSRHLALFKNWPPKFNKSNEPLYLLYMIISGFFFKCNNWWVTCGHFLCEFIKVLQSTLAPSGFVVGNCVFQAPATAQRHTKVINYIVKSVHKGNFYVHLFLLVCLWYFY